jgi:hypothetical protein
MFALATVGNSSTACKIGKLWGSRRDPGGRRGRPRRLEMAVSLDDGQQEGHGRKEVAAA